MEQIKKYIRGNEKRGREVIAELEKLGGENTLELKGRQCDSIYFISGCECNMPNTIHAIQKDSFAGQLLLSHPEWKEIELPKDGYPKSFLDCCKILYPYYDIETISQRVKGYKGDLLTRFQKLLICRDAYWKFYGEETGLGKPWEPDWYNSCQHKHCIYTHGSNVKKGILFCAQTILAFPTKEMQDAFYNNFIELIEGCKELL